MLTIRSWNDLEQFGIVPLTGEACPLSMRILCDLTPRGERIVSAVLGSADLKVTLSLRPAYNGAVCRLTGGESPEERATKAIMLPYDMLRTLAVFVLIDAGCEEVYLAEGKPTIGMKPDDFRELLAENGEHATDVHRMNLRFTYGTTIYTSPYATHDPENADCPRNEIPEVCSINACSCPPKPQELDCWRTIRPIGAIGAARLKDPATVPNTMPAVPTLEGRTRNTHVMSGRTV